MDHIGLDGPKYIAWGMSIEDHHANPVRLPDGNGWKYPTVGKIVEFHPTDDDGTLLPDGTEANRYSAVIEWANGDRRYAVIAATGTVTLLSETN